MAKVAVFSLASDYGCQVQITNADDKLLEVLGQFDLAYWQLASSGHVPEEYDVAVIEGAVTTDEHVELLKRVRATAGTVIVIGACAVTGGIPALATSGVLEDRFDVVYGEGSALAFGGRISPLPVDAIIDVDYRVPGCPIEPAEFVAVLQRALMAVSDHIPREPMCAACKIEENVCFYESGTVCMGLITRTGCGAKCVSLGRPCTGCRGIAADANLVAARAIAVSHGIAAEKFDSALSLYNSAKGVVR
ncbi:MAG: NADH:ubiquinone oxidoreductase [Coriobacteriia bacterium]|nr:NADH:ubiquinone oxidoreductase [Coriobacteriia bacterium]